MNGSEELVKRIALHWAEAQGGLSQEALAELELAVQDDPDKFLTQDSDRAFHILIQAVEHYGQLRSNDEILDDEEYLRIRDSAFAQLQASCSEALELDPNCTDAKLIMLLTSDLNAEELLGRLLDLKTELDGTEHDAAGHDGIFLKPCLRVRSALARALFDTARFKQAQTECEELLDLDPEDEQGARFTLALIYARLEDEASFEKLWDRFERRGNAWFFLAHALMLYKLDRIPAATRAIKGYSELCQGGAFCLFHPAYVDVYIPDRPQTTPGSFEEVLMAIHEADPLIMDTPDFVRWAQEIPELVEASSRFEREQGFEW